MRTFKYPITAQFIYRFANIPVTFLLVVHLLLLIWGMTYDWKYVLPALLNIIIIYILNRFYLKMYKLFPYKIEADDKKIVFSDFFFQKKEITMYYKDITDIKGGIFSGKPAKPIYILDKNDNIIGINQHLKDFNAFLTILLSHIPKDLYIKVLKDIEALKDKRIAGIFKRKSK